jgi:hypothetical protein
MKIVFSYTDWNHKENYFNNNLAKISHKLVKKLGYETLLFVNKENLSKFDNIGYDEIEIIDTKLLNKLPKNVWSLGKIAAFSLINEPFCHIDFDVFLTNKILDEYKNKNIFCFHREPWRPMYQFSPYYEKAIQDLDIKEDNFFRTYNCATIGGKATKEMNESANIVLEYAIKNKEFLEKQVLEHWYLPVLFEQILFVNICRQKLGQKEIPVILSGTKKEEMTWNFVYSQMRKMRIYHLWGAKKEIIESLDKLSEFAFVN